MEKMKMSIGTMAALVLVAVAVSTLLISFGMVQATADKVKQSFDLELKQNGDDVDVKVKAQGLAPTTKFTVRAYSANNCGTFLALIGTADTLSDGQGKLKISGTISSAVLGDVESVSIRGEGTPGPIVQCFRDTT